MKIFISSTHDDLKAYRDATVEVVNRYKCMPLAMEFFGSDPQEPTKVCEKEIKACDVFVGIYAHRYGFIPDSKTKSITQLEYELAKELKKECLCFIVKEDFPWNPRFVEREKYDELLAFLDTVKKERTVEFFESVKDFQGKFAISLARLREEKLPDEKVERPCIPLAPTPFIAHPYPLPANFTGREAEQAMLSNWLFNEEQPVFVMEAIGGMGKSALTWVWLQRHILERELEIEGVFWWSFYEKPFEVFINHLACYVLGKVEMSGDSLLSGDLEKVQAVLHQRRFLLILDGLERALHGYAGMEAMFIQEQRFKDKGAGDEKWEMRHREAVHPRADRFLKHLASPSQRSKTLMTSRLMPICLEKLDGVKHESLTGLSPGDAVRFLRSEGVQGTRAELEQAARVYDCHPLMVKLLSSAVKRSRTKDIKDAHHHNLIDEKEPKKILTTAFGLLSKEEQKVAAAISVFRSAFSFEAAKALFPEIEEERLWHLLQELVHLGFLFFSEKENRFDFHPIMRAFLYDSLTNRDKVHLLAVQYFQALPKAEKIVSLGDLSPVIELYHHLVKAGEYDDARKLFQDRIHEPCYYQLSTYHFIIDLLRELFADGEENLPCLEEKSDQAWTLAALANSYALSGQPSKSVTLFIQCINIQEKNGDKSNLAIGLENAATDQLAISRLSATTVHLRKSIALCREIEEEFWETVAHAELGRVLAVQGQIKGIEGRRPCAEEEFNRAFELAEKLSDPQFQGLAVAYRALLALMQGRLAAVRESEKDRAAAHNLEALEQAWQALAFAEETAKTRYPHPRDFVQAYRLLAEGLLQSMLSPGVVPMRSFEVPLYDAHFQEIVDKVKVARGKELVAAERLINEALSRCRRVNLVELEPDILVACARLEWARACVETQHLASQKKHASLQKRQEVVGDKLESIVREAEEIARRAGYRLKLADLHLFCGQVLLELKEGSKLLGLDAREHLQKAKEFALDVSKFEDLYQSADPDFYKGIPEYEMLKRGMTKEERIENGYLPVYRMAEALEERLGR